MNLSDLNNLDFSSAGSWPAPIRAAAILILCAGVLGAGYWFDTKDQIATLQKAEEQEKQKKQVFEAKQRKAANLALVLHDRRGGERNDIACIVTADRRRRPDPCDRVGHHLCFRQRPPHAVAVHDRYPAFRRRNDRNQGIAPTYLE